MGEHVTDSGGDPPTGWGPNHVEPDGQSEKLDTGPGQASIGDPSARTTEKPLPKAWLMGEHVTDSGGDPAMGCGSYHM